MADTLTKEQRSKNMAAIKSKETKPELFLRHALFTKGYRYRVNVNYISGRPDLFLRKYNVAIFVNGCFWHRHERCQYSYMPKTNLDFWKKKFEANIQRDRRVQNELSQENIRQLIIWECFIKKMMKNDKFKEIGMRTVEQFILSEKQFTVIE